MSSSPSNVIEDQGNGLKKVVLKGPKGSSAEVYLHGAHVTSWKNNDGKELIFVSKQAVFKPPKAIRGGIPVCFPQFGDMGPVKAQHGFARNSQFAVVHASEDSAVLSLTPSEEQLQGSFPEHRLSVKVTLGDNTLTQELEVTNVSKSDVTFSFTAALHSYFRVADVSQTTVTGLSGLKYLDNMKNRQQGTDEQQAISIGGEIDRIYVQAPNTIGITDKAARQKLELQKTNFPDAVVWNPWIDKSVGMADFGDHEYKEMVCVEAALASSGPVQLGAGQSWSAKQVLVSSKL